MKLFECFGFSLTVPHLLTAISGPEPQSLEEPKEAERFKEWLTLFSVVALSIDMIPVIDFIFKRYTVLSNYLFYNKLMMI